MNEEGELIFRYDNVPHHSGIATFPHHKHLANTVLESAPVTLRDVVEENIEEIMDEEE